ncbi:MAG: sulfotransferase family protein [Candidatus Portiera sp.]|nr:sulfotransferase family protein [Portiera sp.]
MINFPDINGRWITFFHIPKTGGSTVLYGIFSNGIIHSDTGNFFPASRRLRFNAWHYNHGNSHHGNPNDGAYKYADHFPYIAAKKLDYSIHDHSIAFVRNPWQRCVSAYLYTKNLRLTNKTASFGEWIDSIDHEREDCWLPQNPNPQYKYLIDEQGKIAVSRIYKLEEINLVELFSDLLGKKLPQVRINVTPPYDFRSFYNDGLIEKVARIYAKDIDLFSYKYK